MRKKRKTIWSIIILGTAIAWSSYLILKPAPAGNSPVVQIAPNNPSGKTASQNLNFVSQSLANLTDEFTSKSLQKLIKDNEKLITQEINGSATAKLLPEKTDVDKLISEIINNEAESETVKPEEILVNKDNSKEMQILYVLFVDQTIRTVLQDDGDTFTADKPLTEVFSKTASKFDNAVEILKSVQVPAPWVDIHRQILETLLKEKNIFLSLAAADTDPLRFFIAAYKILPSELEKEFTKIQAQIDEKIKDEKLI